jgi:hypothetical protein
LLAEETREVCRKLVAKSRRANKCTVGTGPLHLQCHDRRSTKILLEGMISSTS